MGYVLSGDGLQHGYLLRTHHKATDMPQMKTL